MRRMVVLIMALSLAVLPGRPATVAAQAPGLILMLATDMPDYAPGAPVRFTVAVDNPGDAPVTVTFPSAQLFDIAVSGEQQAVWRWGADRDFAQVESERTFPPGVTVLGRPDWAWRDGSGTALSSGLYHIEASLATAPPQRGNTLTVSLR